MLWAFGTTTANTNDLWNNTSDTFGLNQFNGNSYGVRGISTMIDNNFLIKSELHNNNFLAFNITLNGIYMFNDYNSGSHSNRPIHSTFNLLTAGGADQVGYNWNGWNADTLMLDKVLSVSENHNIHMFLNTSYSLYR
jgi:hypothetical protein